LTHLLAGERAALMAVAMLALTPLMYGHSFINPKDAPLAWLLVWVMYYACRAISEGEPSRNTVVGLGVSLGVAVGTRVMGLQSICYIAAALLLAWIVEHWRPAAVKAPVRRTALALLAAVPLAYVIMGVFWPWAVINPLNPILASEEFAHFPWDGWLLWRGEMIPATNLPRDYLPSLLLYQLSEHTLIGLALTAIAAVVAVARRRLFADPRTLQYAVVVQAALVPVAAFVILRPTIYNGMRHFLFVVPPLVILAAVGWDRLLAALARWRAARLLTGAVFVGLLTWQALRMIELHPYEYVAYNRVVGGVSGAAGKFELDYWDTSLAEAAHRLTAHLKKVHATAPPVVFICGNRLSASAFLPRSVRLTWDVEDADYFISVVPSGCRWHVDVTRNRIIEVRRNHVTLSYVIDLDAGRTKPRY
jgi:hypothetical protein